MNDYHFDEPFPRTMLVTAGLMIAFAIGAAGFGRATHIGTVSVAESQAWQSIRVRFEDRPDGAIVMLDEASGDERARLAAGQGGFVRGVLRSLARERAQSGIDAGPPFELTRWQDGRLSLQDLATGRRIEIDAFGPDNAASFRNLLDSAQGDAQTSRGERHDQHV
jgi:putative photosynthetic complex assembly protein